MKEKKMTEILQQENEIELSEELTQDDIDVIPDPYYIDDEDEWDDDDDDYGF